ncbi:hypothetical protein Tco_1573906, partial [Tanacetum coccineum]
EEGDWEYRSRRWRKDFNASGVESVHLQEKENGRSSKWVMCGDKQQSDAREQAGEHCGIGSSNQDGFGCDWGRGCGSVKNQDCNERFRDKSHFTCYMLHVTCVMNEIENRERGSGQDREDHQD